ncbi:MAG TPA: hypothetical protein VMV49_18310 [Candidatus Deferrimicrobium sp.]|nr:hypothetical protein [Candidatus Deferrimicrobium sp.]
MSTPCGVPSLYSSGKILDQGEIGASSTQNIGCPGTENVPAGINRHRSSIFHPPGTPSSIPKAGGGCRGGDERIHVIGLGGCRVLCLNTRDDHHAND